MPVLPQSLVQIATIDLEKSDITDGGQTFARIAKPSQLPVSQQSQLGHCFHSLAPVIL